MTMLMDNEKENSSKERVQHLLNKNAELETERRKAAQAQIPSDPSAWQTMRENYEAIVLEDYAFSEQHDIEYALWQLHYRRIDELRVQYNAILSSAGPAQNGKVTGHDGPDRLAMIRSQFKTFLSGASGFYHDLMMKIRAKYGLQFGCLSDDPDYQIPVSRDANKTTEVEKALRSCQQCLIYLGDLSRYKGLFGEADFKAREFSAASSYYMQACSLWPLSGNPHHQLAILYGYSNDELASIYRYFRSLAIENPFITARENLIMAFEKNRQSYNQLFGDAKTTKVKAMPPRMPRKGRNKYEARPPLKDNKMEAIGVKGRAPSTSEIYKAFMTRFIRLNGILFTRTSLETFPEVLPVAKNNLKELLSSGPNEELNFGSDAAECRLAIVRMVAILIFTVYNASRKNESQSYTDIVQRSVLLQNASTATFEFMGCVIERCDQLKDPSSSYLLSAILVFVEWMACCQDFAVGNEMDENQLNARSFFWNTCVSFLNKLLSSGYAFVTEEDGTFFSNISKYDESETANRLALPEDFELRGFIPLVPAQRILDFSRKHSSGGEVGSKEKTARVQRIVAAGKVLVNIVRVGREGVYFDTKLQVFLYGTEPQDFDDSLLSCHLELNSRGSSLDKSVGGHIFPSDVSKTSVVVDSEDEDEVIVFKPSTNSNYVDEFFATMTSSEVLSGVGEPAGVHFGNENVASSVAQQSSLLQAVSRPCIVPTVTDASSPSLYLQPIQHNTGKWALEHTPILNGVVQLNLVEKESSLKSDLQGKFEVPQAATLSMPYSQNVDAGANHNYSVQSKYDSVVSTRAPADGLSLKSSSIIPPGLRKNPVGRPVKPIGPPPGFGSSRNIVDESLHKLVMNNDVPSCPYMEDYSWLNAFQVSSTNQNFGFSSSLSHLSSTHPSISESIHSNSSMGVPTFPFPGKQVSALEIQSDNQKGWVNFQLPEHRKQNEEQQLQKVKQQPIGPRLQFQGQSLWNGHFFV